MRPDAATRIYAVRTLADAERIVAAAGRMSLRDLLLRGIVALWVFVANLCLDVVHRIMFRRRRARAAAFSDIVVYTVGIVGDNVVMLPALAALRARYPDASITVVTNCQTWDPEAAEGVLGPSPLKDRLIIIDDHPVRRAGFRFIMDSRLRGLACDLFVNLSPFGNRGLLGAVAREMIFAYRLGAAYAVGFRMSTYSRGHIFDTVQHRFVQNEPRRAAAVLAELGMAPTAGDLFPHDAEARDAVLQRIAGLGGGKGPFIVLNPGAKFEAKCWPPERFAEAGELVAEACGATVVVTGAAAEYEVAESVAALITAEAVNLAGGTSIQELVELLRLSAACITNDTGTMHIAAMVGTPTVAIFSSRHSPTHWLPAGDTVVSLICTIDCMYCYDDYCRSGACLDAIAVDVVVEALGRVMEKGRKAA